MIGNSAEFENDARLNRDNDPKYEAQEFVKLAENEGFRHVTNNPRLHKAISQSFCCRSASRSQKPGVLGPRSQVFSLPWKDLADIYRYIYILFSSALSYDTLFFHSIYISDVKQFYARDYPLCM